MSTKKEPPKAYERMLEAELERALAALKRTQFDSEEYAKTLTSVERLYEMLDEETKPSNYVSKETWATIGANLLGIFMIIKHEDVNVIASKALSFVIRTR